LLRVFDEMRLDSMLDNEGKIWKREKTNIEKWR